MNSVVEQVAVIGAGYMGGGIAQVLALAGYTVRIADTDPQTTARQLERLQQETAEFEDQGLFAPGSTQTVRARLSAADSVSAAVAGADFVEEAVLEVAAVKAEVLAAIEAVSGPDVVIGSNTSTLPIGELAAGMRHPERFLGVHFSNPAPFIPGVELIAHPGTLDTAIESSEALVARTGKLSARVRDQAGFVLNRLQFVLLKEAAALVEEGVATAEDVDTIVRTTFGFRLPFFGPFAIADMAGLDTYGYGYGTLSQHYGKRLAAPPALTELVASGRFGVKQGGGFVVPAGDTSALVAYRNRAYARLADLLAELGPAPIGPADPPGTATGPAIEGREP